MKRDHELMRKMVQAIEDDPSGWVPHTLKIEAYFDTEFGHHTRPRYRVGGPIRSVRGVGKPLSPSLLTTCQWLLDWPIARVGQAFHAELLTFSQWV
jgi:hypothetical protein